MGLSPELGPADLAALCSRAFPDHARQRIVDIRPLPSRQHEMIAFGLEGQTADSIPFHEELIVRRYVSTISWWRPDDRGKAQREATVCRWLHEEGFPVPVVYAREFGAQGDVVLFARVPGHDLASGEQPLRELAVLYAEPFGRLLAGLHSLSPPDRVRQVVPQVTLPGALASLTALAIPIDKPDLHTAINRIMAHAYDVAESGPVPLHGDYHLLNALADDGQITGIIDWEFAALGDPRWDVANAYMQLVDLGAAEAADRFLAAYLAHSGRQFAGPPLYHIVTALQQWAISEWLVQRDAVGETHAFALAQDLIALRDTHQRRAELALRWLEA